MIIDFLTIFFENNGVIINQNKRFKIINKSFSKILEKKGWLKFEKKGILIPFKDN